MNARTAYDATGNPTPAFEAWLAAVDAALDGPAADFTDAPALQECFEEGMDAADVAADLLDD